jgi:RNA polymerase sigma-70 factor (ECF subfamily)
MKTEKSLEDQQLILDVIAGNEQAFYRVFHLYHHGIFRYAIKFLKSPDLAADVVQDVFMKVWESRGTINPSCPFKAFLFTVAKNHVLNIIKRGLKEKSIRQEIIKYATVSANQCENTVILNDLTRFAEMAIENLPPQRRVVFRMFKDQGLDYRQIAHVLGLSTNTVRDHLSKASKAIRGFLRVHAGTISILIVLLGGRSGL